MVQRSIYCIIICFCIISCSSSKIKLEKNTYVSIKSAVYIKWVSGINGGGSGLNLNIKVSEKDIENKLTGIYFKERYTSLKFSKPNVYTGFIRTSKKQETNLDVLDKTKTNKLVIEKNQKQKLSFLLGENEAVLECLIKNKKKYFKIILEKKNDYFPQ